MFVPPAGSVLASTMSVLPSPETLSDALTIFCGKVPKGTGSGVRS